MARIALFQDLPTELLLSLLPYLSPSSLVALLRVNRFFHTLITPYFLSNLQLNILSLPRCPLARPNALEPYTLDSLTSTASITNIPPHHQNHLENLKSITLTLTTPHQIYTTLTGLPFICTHTAQQTYLGLEYLNKALHSALCSLSATLTTHSALLSTLTVLRIGATVPDVGTSSNPCNTATPAVRVQQHALVAFLRAAGHCKNLRTLEIDTADAEDTSWNVACGVGHCCAVHVCAVLGSTLRSLHGLKALRWRHRDVCPTFFEAFLEDKENDNHDESGPSEGDACKPTLETLILDLRRQDIQRTGWDTWAAQARDCGCRCWCVGCLRHSGAGSNTHGDAGNGARRDERAIHGGRGSPGAPVVVGAAQPLSVLGPGQSSSMPGHEHGEEGHGEKTVLERMVEAGKVAAARMGNVKRMEVLGYECPEKELRNWTRRPVVWDCVSGQKRSVKGAG